MLKWAVDTFGGIDDRDPIALDERVRRYFEESAELFQACGLDLDSAVKILKRVFGRPPGEPEKELGQAQMTLSILAEVLGITAVDAEIHEFERVQSVPREEFRRRHRAKSEIGI
jgi:hypothetical protein